MAVDAFFSLHLVNERHISVTTINKDNDLIKHGFLVRVFYA
jgi:hypothetical protein